MYLNILLASLEVWGFPRHIQIADALQATRRHRIHSRILLPSLVLKGKDIGHVCLANIEPVLDLFGIEVSVPYSA